jgi:hypothetical protein
LFESDLCIPAQSALAFFLVDTQTWIADGSLDWPVLFDRVIDIQMNSDSFDCSIAKVIAIGRFFDFDTFCQFLFERLIAIASNSDPQSLVVSLSSYNYFIQCFPDFTVPSEVVSTFFNVSLCLLQSHPDPSVLFTASNVIDTIINSLNVSEFPQVRGAILSVLTPANWPYILHFICPLIDCNPTFDPTEFLSTLLENHAHFFDSDLVPFFLYSLAILLSFPLCLPPVSVLSAIYRILEQCSSSHPLPAAALLLPLLARDRSLTPLLDSAIPVLIEGVDDLPVWFWGDILAPHIDLVGVESYVYLAPLLTASLDNCGLSRRPIMHCASRVAPTAVPIFQSVISILSKRDCSLKQFAERVTPVLLPLVTRIDNGTVICFVIQKMSAMLLPSCTFPQLAPVLLQAFEAIIKRENLGELRHMAAATAEEALVALIRCENSLFMIEAADACVKTVLTGIRLLGREVPGSLWPYLQWLSGNLAAGGTVMTNFLATMIRFGLPVLTGEQIDLLMEWIRSAFDNAEEGSKTRSHIFFKMAGIANFLPNFTEVLMLLDGEAVMTPAKALCVFGLLGSPNAIMLRGKPERDVYMSLRKAEEPFLRRHEIYDQRLMIVVNQYQDFILVNVVMPEAEMIERLGLSEDSLMTIFNCIRALDREEVSDAIHVLLRWLTLPRDELPDLEFTVLKLLLRLCLIFVRPPREDGGGVANHLDPTLFTKVVRAASNRLSNIAWAQRLIEEWEEELPSLERVHGWIVDLESQSN